MESVVCPNCGSVNPGGNQFCQACGKPLNVAAAVTADATVVKERGKKSAATPPPPPPAGGPLPPPIEMVPPPPPPYYTTPPAYLGTPVRSLGIRTDGWSEVVEDAAPLADKVKQGFLSELAASGVGGLHIAEADLRSENAELRSYQMIENGKGAVIAVRAAPFGNSLVVSWDLYTRRTINWLGVGILAGAVFLFALAYNLTSGTFIYGFFRGLFMFIATTLSWLLTPGLAVMLAGKMLRDDWLAFFVKDLDDFAAEDAVALSTVVDNALTRAVEKAQEVPAKTRK